MSKYWQELDDDGGAGGGAGGVGDNDERTR